MYSTKSVGPRMEPWGTTALTGYSYDDFPFRTTWSRLLIRKDEIRPNTRQKLHFWPILPFFLVGERGGGGGGAKRHFPENLAVSHTTSCGFLASCQDLEKINDPIPKKRPNRWKNGGTDRSYFIGPLKLLLGVQQRQPRCKLKPGIWWHHRNTPGQLCKFLFRFLWNMSFNLSKLY